jgi:hypothetical protein
MRLWKCRFLPVIFSACLLPPARSIAQGQPETQDTTAKPRTPKELKRQEKKLRKELSGDSQVWLMEEVPYIITEDERRAFLDLGTAEEREQFIELSVVRNSFLC